MRVCRQSLTELVAADGRDNSAADCSHVRLSDTNGISHLESTENNEQNSRKRRRMQETATTSINTADEANILPLSFSVSVASCLSLLLQRLHFLEIWLVPV